MSPSTAIATSAQLGADAGASAAARGGNAVDAAVASILVSMVTEPGICSLGGGAFLTIWPPDALPVTVDGQVAMPGREAPPERFGQGERHVRVAYGGDLETVVGPGSVAVPGAVAALGRAWRRYGRLEWEALFRPAIEWAREGFPLSAASRHWLEHSHEAVFGRDPGCREPIHGPDGSLKGRGEPVRLPRLAETLEVVAAEGPRELYEGDLGRRIAESVRERGGLLTRDDLTAYEPVVRSSLTVGWKQGRVATNPPPAVGGACLAAMLMLAEEDGPGVRSAGGIARLERLQAAVVRFVRQHGHEDDGLSAAARELLRSAGASRLRSGWGSPSTTHVSAVDADGLACSVSASSGYGAGVVPDGTGIWLNNCLGERELNPQGFHALEPGTRLPSNMAPTVVRGSRSGVLAIGSPGAARITSALLVTLMALVEDRLSLDSAVAHPRLHVEVGEAETLRAAHEPGLPVGEVELPHRPFDSRSMYFGAATAARSRGGAGLEAAADPRREGGTALHRSGDPPGESPGRR